jgi:hypothetical protein
MAQLRAQNITAPYSTFNSAHRDVHNHYHHALITSSWSQPSSSLSFNDAPINLLSSHFTGRKEELGHIGKVCMGHGNSLTHCVVIGMLGLGKTQLSLQFALSSYDQQLYPIIF